MCTNLTAKAYPVVVNRSPGGAVGTGCRHDDRTRPDGRGDYSYVIGTEAQRRAIDVVPGATFVPFALSRPFARHTLVWRNMMPEPWFARSTANVPADGDPAAAARVMGPYFPSLKTCTLASLRTAGPARCSL